MKKNRHIGFITYLVIGLIVLITITSYAGAKTVQVVQVGEKIIWSQTTLIEPYYAIEVNIKSGSSEKVVYLKSRNGFWFNAENKKKISRELLPLPLNTATFKNDLSFIWRIAEHQKGINLFLLDGITIDQAEDLAIKIYNYLANQKEL